MSPWIIAARPKTLTAAVIPVVCASALCVSEGKPWNFWITFFAICSASCIQIATNFINDLLDYKKGSDTSERVGPIRVTQAGLISPYRLVLGIWTVLFLAVAFGAPLVWVGGLPILIIGLVSLLFAYAYTGGPLPLAYLGLGEIFVVVFFGIISVCGVYYLHTREMAASSAVLGLQLGSLATVLLAINNLRDMKGDAKAGKKTLAVRFGERFAKAEIILFALLPIVLGLWWFKAAWLAFLLPLPSLLIAFKLFKLLRVNTSESLILALPIASLYYLLFGAFITVGFILGG